MAITERERSNLITYIENRMCQEFRSGEPCKDGPRGNRTVRGQPHPACAKAAEMIEIVQRA